MESPLNAKLRLVKTVLKNCAVNWNGPNAINAFFKKTCEAVNKKHCVVIKLINFNMMKVGLMRVKHYCNDCERAPS